MSSKLWRLQPVAPQLHCSTQHFRLPEIFPGAMARLADNRLARTWLMEMETEERGEVERGKKTTELKKQWKTDS